MSSCRLWAVAVVGTAGYMNRCNSGSRSRCNSGCRNRYKQWAAGIGAVVGCSCRNMCREKSQVMGEGSALSTNVRASYTARIMVKSVMPFIIIQLSQILNRTSPICLVVLISLIISVSLLLAYCLYQVFHPSILKRRITYANPKHIMPRTEKKLKCCSLGRLLTANDEPDVEDMRRLYEVIGENSDQLISASELRALITGFPIKDKDSAIDDDVGEVMRDFDSCGDSKINIDVFIKEISKWRSKNSAACSSDNDLKTRLVVDHFNLAANREHELLGVQSDEVAKIKNPKWSASKAVLMLLLGSLIAATFADSLINAVGNFSTDTNIPSFLVSFTVLPFAISSEAVAALMFASQNKMRISLTFSKIYGAVSMNNLLCLSVFLGLLYFRHLSWNFTSDVLIILIVWSFLPKNMG
ncbi:hypothetical protein VitviT2T_017602 [Vitis vinifera]|uniref:Sodium/calcium exchanger membrane region domain-containing protein n=1 Tax=Vitis vinifera TaxID=29760 RepID=A0ABY9CX63_VITVI|nr:hypothetical protein VitviT2T_017602 [Vitis vinifera]